MDIRKFFAKAGGGPAKPAGGDKKDEKKAAAAADSKPPAAPGAAPPAAKPASPAKPPSSAAKKASGASPAAVSKASKPKASPKPKQAQPKAAAPKRKKTIVDSDSDVDEDVLRMVDAANAKTEKADPDFAIDLTGGDGSDGGSDQEWELEDSDLEQEEEEGLGGGKPAAKKRKGASGAAVEAAPAKAKSKSATPAKKKPAAGAGAGAATAAGSSKKKAAAAKGPLAGLSPEALAAVAAVDKAAESLPPEDSLNMSFMAETAYAQRAPDEPPHWRQKEAPRGHPDCLTGKTFVISGVLDSMKREEAADFVKRHGGKVTQSVSSRTSFLVVGGYCGRGKHSQARAQENCRIIDEEGLFALVRAAPDPNAQQAQQQQAQQQAQQAQQQQGVAAMEVDGMKQEPGVKQEAGTAGTGRLGARSFYGGGSGAAAAAAVPAAPSALTALNNLGRTGTGAGAGATGAGPSSSARPAAAAGAELWVEKWRPKRTSELVGNGSLVTTLRTWLADWERVHLQGGEPRAPAGSGTGARAQKLAADMKKKAVLLSGPPGIGKTTSALIVCRELGFEPVEVNASDTRGKADSSVIKGVAGKLANAVKELSTNLAISYDAQGRRKKLCLIMDEVDGMSAGDRGGVADLIQTIKKSKVPIIAICNDKYSQKLKSLRNHCLELEFRKPTAQQVSKRMLEICQAEGLSVNQATMEALAQSANGDIRLVLGQLQMIRLRSRALSYDQVKGGGLGTAKDAEMSPFEAARRLLSGETEGLSLGDQLELVFQDADLVPLLVQENYLNHRPRIASNDVQRLKVIARAADCLSGGDTVNRRVRQYQSWSLMPFAAALGTVMPAAWMRGSREIFGLYPTEPNFPRFTAWLGSFSSGRKQQRLMGELHTRMLSSGNIECDRTSLRLSYLPVLRNTLVRPLARDGKEGVPQALKAMREYCLARDDLDFIIDVTKFKTKASWGEDPYKSVDSSVKSAFTRAFNQQHVKPKTGFGLEDAKKRKGGGGKKGKGAAAEEEEEEDMEGLEGGEGEGGSPSKDEEEDEMDPVMVRRKAMALKSKGLTLTLKDGSTAATGRGGRGGRGSGRGGGRGSKASGGAGGSGRGKASGRGGAASGRGRGGKK